MTPNAKRAIVLCAVAGGVVTGTILATTRAHPIEPRMPVALEPPVHLPAVRAEFEAPVIYEAHVETPRTRSWPTWMSGAVAAAIVLGIAYVIAARPQITAAAPASVFAGSAATISYSAAGNGALEITVDSGSYRRTQRTAAHQGTIAVPATATRSGQDIFATLRMSDWAGSDARIVRVAVLAPPAAVVRVVPSNAPVIRTFTLSQTSARGDARILARYATNASSGSVKMTDAAGVTWFTGPLHRSGVTSVPVPRMHADTPFIVTVQAQRNAKSVTASAGFIARAQPAPRSAPKTATGFVNPAFSLPWTARAGTVLPVTIPAGYTDVSLALNGPDGSVLAAPVERSGRRMLLHVPAVRAKQLTFLTLTYQRGKAKEALIRRLTIAP